MSDVERLDRLPLFPVPAGAMREDGCLLQISGLVRQSVALSRAEIAALPAVTLRADFACEEGWRVPGLCWTGIPLSDLLALAGPLPEACYVAAGAGDFVSVLPLAQVAAGGALLAYGLDGAPLPVEHGGPLRLVAGWTACYQSVKWVDRLILTAGDDVDTARSTALARLENARRDRG